MKVVINALSLKSHMGGGLTFGLNLARALGAGANGHTVYLLGGEHNRELLAPTGCEFISLGAGLEHPGRRILAERLRLPRRVKALTPDLFLSLDGTIPRRVHCRSVAVLQNLIYFHAGASAEETLPLHQKAYAYAQASYFRTSWRRSAPRASRCLCVSHAAKSEFVDHYPAMRGKVEVIYEALDPAFLPGALPDLEHPYLLGVGTLYPHKRFDLLIDLLARLKKFGHLKLKIVGPDWGRRKERLQAHAEKLGVAGRVEFPGFCPNLETVPLYQQALCCGLFSETEAHPLSVAEALSCGTPVVVANRSGMAELGADAALRVEPDNLAEAAHFVGRLLTDEGFRQERRELALQSARRFRPEAVARQYWDMFEAIVSDSNRYRPEVV